MLFHGLQPEYWKNNSAEVFSFDLHFKTPMEQGMWSSIRTTAHLVHITVDLANAIGVVTCAKADLVFRFMLNRRSFDLGQVD